MGTPNRIAEPGGLTNDAVAARLAQAKRRRVWCAVIASNAIALVMAMVGCFFLLKTQGVKADVARMRDEVGESLTMMSLGGASEAVARHIPRLVDTVGRWDRKFATRRGDFRGLDEEINVVQEMHRLGTVAEHWRLELEGISPMQRNEQWRKNMKAQVEQEQKKWPNRLHEKDALEWLSDLGKEFGFGVKHGLLWPVGICRRAGELLKGGRGVDTLGVGDMLHYVLFPYRLSSFTLLRLLGIALTTSALGYLLCWIGLKSRFGWLSYAGLLNFVYLLNIALFIAFLEMVG